MPTPSDPRDASPAIRLHTLDNVVVARRDIAPGETVAWEGGAATATSAVPLGHKLAILDLAPGQTVRKYGAPIGSATQAVRAGDHLHLHNMRSDYISTHTRQAATLKEES